MAGLGHVHHDGVQAYRRSTSILVERSEVQSRSRWLAIMIVGNKGQELGTHQLIVCL